MTLVTHLGGVAAIVVLMGCGSPSPDAPVSGHTTGSAEAIRSALVGDTPKISPCTNAPARQASTQTSPLEPTAQPVSTPEARLTDTTGAPCPAPDTRVQTLASPADALPSAERVEAEYDQREAQISWGAEVRENPDVTQSSSAWSRWAEQLDDGIDPVTLTYALVGQDDHEWAQELWEEQFIQEVEADAL
jgi:hypothetical protein